MTKKRPATKHTTAGRRLIASAKEALAWAKGENVPGVRVTVVEVNRAPTIKPDGPAFILLAVIAHHPDAVEDALRKAS